METQTHEARELQLFIEFDNVVHGGAKRYNKMNDADLYRQQTQCIQKNLSKRWQKGTYNHTLAPKMWKYLADNGAKRYNKMFDNVVHGFGIFTPEIRREVAQTMADNYKTELEAGNFTN